MSVNYTITLSDNQKKCMDMVTTDIQDWIFNAVSNRARKAQNVIIASNTNHCNENGIAIGVGVTAQIQQAYDLGVVKTAVQTNAESDPHNQ